MAAHLLWIYVSYFLFAVPACVVLETGDFGWGFVGIGMATHTVVGHDLFHFFAVSLFLASVL